MASDDDFAALFEQSASNAPRARKLRAGEVVDGTVVAIGDDTVFVDVGTKAEARLDRGSVVDGDGKPYLVTANQSGQAIGVKFQS